MDEGEFNERKKRLFEYIERVGIDIEEVENIIEKEKQISKNIGMNEEDSNVRALIATTNYYRKYLDKLGNRAKFICLGITQPTDYGLGKKVREIKKRWQEHSNSIAEREDMILRKIVNNRGIPLHTTDTTVIEDKIGNPIILEDEISQNLIGIIKNEDGINFPAIIRVYGKKGCDEQKQMYTWGTISGEQSATKQNPGYITLTTREPNLKILKNSKRITKEEYENLINTEFKDIIIDANDKENFENKIENIKGHFIIKNARILDYMNSLYGTTTSLRSAKDALNIEEKNIAELKLSSNIPLDVDPACKESLYVMAISRNKKIQDDKPLLDVIGIYTPTPIKKEEFEMKEGFFNDDKTMIMNQSQYNNQTDNDFFNEIEKRNNQ